MKIVFKIIVLVISNLLMISPFYFGFVYGDFSTRIPLEFIIIVPPYIICMFVLNVPIIMWLNRLLEPKGEPKVLNSTIGKLKELRKGVLELIDNPNCDNFQLKRCEMRLRIIDKQIEELELQQ